MYVSKGNIYLDTPDPDSKIVMNLLSGSMDIVNKEMYQFLKHIQEKGEVQLTEENRSPLTRCLEQGYVFNDKEEEEKRLKELSEEWDRSFKNRAESITIYTNFTCNLRCVYCFENEQFKKKTGVMSLEMLKAMMNAIDIIHETHHPDHSPKVTIFGGEPLLRSPKQIKLIEELLKALKKRDFKIGIITNGVELPYYTKILSQYGVNVVEVTIDGPKEIHDRRRIFADGRGTFDRVSEGVDACLAKKIPTVIRVNVDKQNIESLPDLADFILDKGWMDQGVSLHLFAVDKAGNECEASCALPTPEMLSRIFEIFDSHKKTRIFNVVNRAVRFFENLIHDRKISFPKISYCGAIAGTQYSYDLSGKIYSCCCINCSGLQDSHWGEFYPEFTSNDQVIEMWRKRKVFNLPPCKDCSEALLCGGGCTRLALLSGEKIEDGVFCPWIKDEFQAVLNYYYPRLKETFLSENKNAT
ncbi:MAG: radical SAM protein [Candidatus Aminicenantes bacterium]|nr:MAG: radical SAM protein [Candidatus Aminicenantes bacterium]